MKLAELKGLVESTATARRIMMRVASDLASHTATARPGKMAQSLVTDGAELLADLHSRIDTAEREVKP